MKYVVEFLALFILLVIKNPLSLKEIINNSEQCNFGISELLLELNFFGNHKQRRNNSIYYATLNIHKKLKKIIIIVLNLLSLLKVKLPLKINYLLIFNIYQTLILHLETNCYNHTIFLYT